MLLIIEIDLKITHFLSLSLAGLYLRYHRKTKSYSSFLKMRIYPSYLYSGLCFERLLFIYILFLSYCLSSNHSKIIRTYQL